MTREFIAYALINIVCVVLLTPLLLSLIKKIKAWSQRRSGPPLLQGYSNLLKLLKKETVYSKQSSWIMRVSPYMNIACMLTAALFVPLLFIPASGGGVGNIILFLYLLALAKFFMALGGLDAGSTFGGMGSSREMSISSIIEPVAMITFAALAFVFHTTNLFEIFTITSRAGVLRYAPMLLPLGISLFIVLITESARVPVDNPETHLELTMVHEAMILEQSGKNLALLELSSGIKQLLFMGILIHLFFPLGIAPALTVPGILIALGMFIAKSVLLAAGIGVFESYLAKLRLFRLPNFFFLAFFLAFLTLLLDVIA